MKDSGDTLITIPNDRLLVANRTTTLKDAFQKADDVLLQAVRGISELVTIPGLINLDFADVRSIMANMGIAMMGVARAPAKTGLSRQPSGRSRVRCWRIPRFEGRAGS